MHCKSQLNTLCDRANLQAAMRAPEFIWYKYRAMTQTLVK